MMFKQNVLKRNVMCFVGAFLLSFQCFAEEVKLAADHPDTYLVKKGDTLWDISGKFLEKPWLWPDIWHNNPDIANPNLIYPGDVIKLSYVNGQPRLSVDRGDAGNTVKLSPSCPDGKLCPQVRAEALEDPIPAIPLDVIDPFLVGDRVVNAETLDQAPYTLMGSQTHVITGAGDHFYARGMFDRKVPVYGIFRKGKVYTDDVTGELLGVQAIDVGSARIKESEGDVAQFSILRSTGEVRINDRLLPSQERRIESIFHPSSPESKIEGKIIDVAGEGVNQVGRMTVVIANKGEREGLKVGNILAIYQQGDRVRDPVTGEWVKLLNERAGLLMVFNVFEKTSYGIVLQADRPLQVGAVLRNP